MAAANNRARGGNLPIYSSRGGFLETFIRRDCSDKDINAESNELIACGDDTTTLEDDDLSSSWRNLTKQATPEASCIDENELGFTEPNEGVKDSDELETGCDAIEDNKSQDVQGNSLKHISVNMIKGDITKISSDIIIISGNDRLSPLGGVAKAVFDAAGSELVADIREKNRGKQLEVGEVLFTSSGALKRNISRIAHIVIPTWNSLQHHAGKKTCVYQFISALYNCFKVCADKSISKITLPAIGTGYSGIPQELCSLVYLFALNKLDEYCKYKHIPKLKIYFVDINASTLDCISKAFSVTSNKDCHNLHDSIEQELATLFPINTYNFSRKTEVKIFQGDITLFLGCSILCAVNQNLKPRGRVAESIFKQAGKDLQKQLSYKVKGTNQTGDVIVTGPWGLYGSYIISCVVPKRRFLFKGRYKDELIQCYKNVIRNAFEKRIPRMTLYVLGADSFYPDMDLCCSALADSLEYLSKVRQQSLRILHITCSDKTLLDCLLIHMRHLNRND
ncbi:hypothetical protein CHS0354_043173 [Potamilus streckersoni]|uniref:Macro domain-containing protein n=1 Tax=Potamilus streckersoni TaxID=2493646 RepID=A0AAE0SP37_9BIVA|nr:hypothetical protein CHS0354_043173 [Potamilus streckersoni]